MNFLSTTHSVHLVIVHQAHWIFHISTHSQFVRQTNRSDCVSVRDFPKQGYSILLRPGVPERVPEEPISVDYFGRPRTSQRKDQFRSARRNISWKGEDLWYLWRRIRKMCLGCSCCRFWAITKSEGVFFTKDLFHQSHCNFLQLRANSSPITQCVERERWTVRRVAGWLVALPPVHCIATDINHSSRRTNERSVESGTTFSAAWNLEHDRARIVDCSVVHALLRPYPWRSILQHSWVTAAHFPLRVSESSNWIGKC